MSYVPIPQGLTWPPTQEEVVANGVRVCSYHSGNLITNTVYLLARPGTEMVLCSLINGNAFYEVIMSKNSTLRYYAVNYSPSSGTYNNFHPVRIEGTRYTATDTGVKYANYQLRTRYTSPWATDVPTYQYSNQNQLVIDYGSVIYPITYLATNGTVTGSSETAVGDTVTASCTFPEGYYMANPENDITVTSGVESVPFTWDATNSQITFTMPEGAVTVSVTGSPIPSYPITYRPTRVTLSGPATAAVGATVNVDCTFPAGYGVKTTDTVSVTCNRTPVAFSWDSENQQITFTMPDPS